MDNITKLNLNSINRKYSDEVITEQYEKAYSTIFFSSNYVFKVFSSKDNLYNKKAIEDEFAWDDSMPFLKPELYEVRDSSGDELDILVLNRLPIQSNVLFGLVSKRLEVDTIIEVGQKLLKLQEGYKRYSISSNELYENYVSNVELQMSFLDKILSTKIKTFD